MTKKKEKEEVEIISENPEEENIKFNKYMMVYIKLNENNPDDAEYIKSEKIDQEFNMLTIVDIFPVDDSVLYQVSLNAHTKTFQPDKEENTDNEVSEDENFMDLDKMTFPTYDKWVEFEVERFEKCIKDFGLGDENCDIAISMLKINLATSVNNGQKVKDFGLGDEYCDVTDKNLIVKDHANLFRYEGKEQHVYVDSFHDDTIKSYLDKRFGNILNMYKELGEFNILNWVSESNGKDE